MKILEMSAHIAAALMRALRNCTRCPRLFICCAEAAAGVAPDDDDDGESSSCEAMMREIGLAGRECERWLGSGCWMLGVVTG